MGFEKTYSIKRLDFNQAIALSVWLKTESLYFLLNIAWNFFKRIKKNSLFLLVFITNTF